MGIQGLLGELNASPTAASSRRIALASLSSAHLAAHNRPLRLAIDISIWLFQVRAGKGGTNAPLRTLYYRILRLLSLGINPVFVFDGPHKPPFKRNKRTFGTGGDGPASLAARTGAGGTDATLFARQVLEKFGIVVHVAQGEAEAECAALQRAGVVDAVLSDDVDTLMFGCGVTLRNYNGDVKAKAAAAGGEGSAAMSNKTPTHVDVYVNMRVPHASATAVAEATGTGVDKFATSLDPAGMVLFALMSGGDYIPQGIEGCGAKTAASAARAGFGRELCSLRPSDKAGMDAWRERLRHEIRTNESKFFRSKHTKLKVPDNFPHAEALRFYMSPVLSKPETFELVRRRLEAVERAFDFDYVGLRRFTLDAFDWGCLSGAKHFIRSLAPALLVRNLLQCARRRADEEMGQGRSTDAASIGTDPDALKTQEAKYVAKIHSRRTHASTDSTPEIRISYCPLDIVPIDLEAEEPDDNYQFGDGLHDPLAVDTEGAVEPLPFDALEDMADDGEPSSTVPMGAGTRGRQRTYDPSKLHRVWVLESVIKSGAPVSFEDWQGGTGNPAPSSQGSQGGRHKRGASTTRASSSGAEGAGRAKRGRKVRPAKDVQQGTLNRFAKVSKPNCGLSPIKDYSPANAVSGSRPVLPSKGVQILDLSASTSKSTVGVSGSQSAPGEEKSRPNPREPTKNTPAVDLSQKTPPRHRRRAESSAPPETGHRTRQTSITSFMSPSTNRGFSRSPRSPVGWSRSPRRPPTPTPAPTKTTGGTFDEAIEIISSPELASPAELWGSKQPELGEGRPKQKSNSVRSPTRTSDCWEGPARARGIFMRTQSENSTMSSASGPMIFQVNTTCSVLDMTGIPSSQAISGRDLHIPTEKNVVQESRLTRKKANFADCQESARDEDLTVLRNSRPPRGQHLSQMSGNIFRSRSQPYGAASSESVQQAKSSYTSLYTTSEPASSHFSCMSSVSLPNPPSSILQTSSRERFVKVRESLEGAWKLVDVDDGKTHGVSLQEFAGGVNNSVSMAIHGRSAPWKESEVRVLDLTHM
ncbi:hypothetical protein BDY21DRAFT_341288 [Lineolata rhizophorae]|uniref:XPG-I domain-containing protein n=1 Tax=Lineolata rhizophorae TaxID=578093 RepID=A0A6A6P448_9PEZI|nr:hypothetical protein BDY21DRAFT_341288 [Lineolata rhizophorae]